MDSGLEMGWVHNIHNVYNKGSSLKINIVLLIKGVRSPKKTRLVVKSKYETSNPSVLPVLFTPTQSLKVGK